jgi:hypothetical protein
VKSSLNCHQDIIEPSMSLSYTSPEINMRCWVS